MDSIKVAKILYGMSLGLDYSDGLEFADQEIKFIAEELDNSGDSLRNVLEYIAASNAGMESFVDVLLNREIES